MTQSERGMLFAPARWQKVRELFAQLDGMDEEACKRELEHVGKSEPDVAAAVSALRCTDGAPVQALLEKLEIATVDEPPQMIGPFRLIRRIGEGGMGDVYLAERSGSDFVQRVALKLLDGGAARVARLAARERRILAGLAHPNITAFVDAGLQDGRAWLAMEYVDGEPLLAYCARLPLTLRERVRLFDQVCAAVAHAHAQLVVHRDLKPSNILVTAEGAVKLLDFGIAMTIDMDTEQSPPTRVFTPEYAAPEQLYGGSITTATDVHALGLLLFELASGKRLPTLEQARDDEWTPTRLARFAAPSAHATNAALTRSLRGDLGRIIAHALARDPAQRYASVQSLRDDLARWLDYRPLGIAGLGPAYVAARFVRRNRAIVAVGAVAAVAMFCAAIFSFWQARQATRMAAQAEHAETFLADLFTDADPFNSKRSDKSKIELLRDAALRIDKDLADAPPQQVKLRGILATALSRLGEPALARDLMHKNAEQTRVVYGERAPEYGAALGLLAIGSEDSGDIDEARARFTQAYAILENAGDAWRANRISVLTGLAKIANRAGDHTEAARLHGLVMRERQAKEGAEGPDIAMDLMNLCADALYQEHFAEAVALGTRAHAMLEKTLGPRHARSIYVDNVLGLAQSGVAGQTDAAIATLVAAAQLARATLPPQSNIRATVISGLGYAQLLAGNDDAAIAAIDEALPAFTAEKHPALGAAELTLGRAQFRAHRAEAKETLRKALADLAAEDTRFAGAAKHSALAQAAYGAALARSGDVAQGERLARAARAGLLAGRYADSAFLGDIDRYLADIVADGAEKQTLRDEALSVYRRVYGVGHPLERSLLAGEAGDSR
jgi:hypothetical protein